MEFTVALKSLDYIVIAIYLVVLLTLGFWVSLRKGHTKDIFLAGRSLGWGNIGLSMWGTNITPTSMIAVCGAAYSGGLLTSNFALLAWPFLMLLGMVFVPHYLTTKISTMPEFMSRRYDESCRNFLSWYTILSTIVVWLGATLFAGGVLIAQLFNCPFAVGVLILAVIATSFTIVGGLTAVVITDSFQCILMVVACLALAVIGFSKVGSYENLVDSVPSNFWHLFQSGEECAYPWYSLALGYPILGIWFWSTDQTMVQRVLGARDLRQGQLSTVFVAYMKVVDPVIFWIPGILCLVLHPNLPSPDHAYVTMVTTYLPTGMVGLIVAVLIAAVISTVDSGLNSLSTVFTLDIYRKMIKPDASDAEIIRIGRIVTVVAAVAGFSFALVLKNIEGTLFFKLQSLIGFTAPPLAAVFIIGVFWKRANACAALSTMIFGTITSLAVGSAFYSKYPKQIPWPEYEGFFLILAFVIFVILCLFMVVISLVTSPPPPEKALPSLLESYRNKANRTKTTWILWAILAVVMVAIYIIFN
ncbi:MAG: sodium:solute symporter family transporter [Planctomycetota bacterium]